MRKTFVITLIVISLITISACQKQNNFSDKSQDPIKVGWISSLTGPVAKYGAYEAGMLAVEDINNSGGINGRPLELIVEDGKCNSKAAVDAAEKLINIDKVKIIVGGHCSSESLAIAPIAKNNKVLMLASITTSPALTPMGDYIFRTSPVSTIQSDLVADLSFNKLNLEKVAIIHEQTDYAKPIAEKIREKFVKHGGQVVVHESYSFGATDFKTTLLKVKDQQADAIFNSAQSPESALNFIKQVHELGLGDLQLFGNEAAAIDININQEPDLYEGFIFGEPAFDRQNPRMQEFIKKYKNKYNNNFPSYGIWTAESYDGVMIIADALRKHGEDVEKIKEYLYNLKDYPGVSGKISIDENGDGVREYKLKIVRDGKVVDYE